MTKGRMVGDVIAEMDLSPATGDELRKELIKFRKAFAEEYDTNLSLPDMQDYRSGRVERMARIYFEHGLEKKGILPGKTRWTLKVPAPRTGEPEYFKPKHEVLELLQKLIASQNINYDRRLKDTGSGEETLPSGFRDPEWNHTVRTTRGKGAGETQQSSLRWMRLRSCGLHSDGGSTEDSRVAPVARMEPGAEVLERIGHYTYGGLPNIANLEARDHHSTRVLESKDGSGAARARHHALPPDINAGSSIDADDDQNFLSALALPFEEGLGSTDDVSHQQSPTGEEISAFEQHVRPSYLEQTAMVGPYRRPSKVIVLKRHQHERQPVDEGLPRTRSTMDSLNRITLTQNESIDDWRKRRRLEDVDPSSTIPHTNRSLDSNNPGAACPVHNSELPVVATHESNLSQAAAKPPENGADSFSPNGRLPVTGSGTPSGPREVREQGQTDQTPGDSKVGLQWSSWLLDPRKPGGAQTGWPGNKPLNQSIHYVFEKTTELLETDGYSGIQFLFKLNNQAGEVIFQVTRDASEEFQIMKENVPRKLKEAIIRSGRKATAIELTLRPVGLTEVGSSEIAAAATVEDEDLYGIDALFE